MRLSSLVAFLHLVSANLVSSQRQFPIGDPRNCNVPEGVNRFEVLPGGGWDNLLNKDMGLVINNNYSMCRMTEDGHYLLPDSSFTIPVKRSKIQLFAETIDSWSEYTDITAESMNVGIGLFNVISGSFSAGYEKVKRNQVKDNTTTTRVQVRHHLYTAKTIPGAQLHPSVKSRLLEIGARLQNNETDSARFAAELIVRDYGTHVITSIDAGAILVKEDFVRKSLTKNNLDTKNEVMAAASASFLQKFSLSAGYGRKVEKAFQDRYEASTTYSEMLTFGGPAYTATFSVKEWEKGLANGLVAIDRSGDPLHYLITHENLPELPEPTLKQVVGLMKNTIEQYYRINTIPGCLDEDSPNFNFQANLDDGTCNTTQPNFSFGGVYQTCAMRPGFNNGNLCGDVAQKNPLTGDYSCPQVYKPVLLNEGEIQNSRMERECKMRCTWWWLWEDCRMECENVYYSSTASYKAYWCAARGPVSKKTGFLFGGVYTEHAVNPLTKTHSCPGKFYSLRIGENMLVCVSDDYELDFRYSLPFAGFFSCVAGNPLMGNMSHNAYAAKSEANSWPHRCPTGYSQHLATVDQGCEINFCVPVKALSNEEWSPIHRPPFSGKQARETNTTDAMYIMGPAQRIWVKEEQGWNETNMAGLEKFMIANDMVTDERSPAGGASWVIISVIAVGSVIIILVIVGIFKVRRRRERNKNLNVDNPEAQVSVGGETGHGRCESFDARKELATIMAMTPPSSR